MSDKNCIIMYADYPKGLPETEKCCINQAIKFGEVIIIGREELKKELEGDFTLLDPNPLYEYLSSFIKKDMKPNHYADYLAYYGDEVIRQVYGLTRYTKFLKVDTDYFITSKFILDEIFNSLDQFVIFDEGFMPKYGKIPQFFPNADVTYLRSDSSEYIIELEEFEVALNDYYINNHYTATGPSLLGRVGRIRNHFRSEIVPWTFDPSIANPGEYVLPLRSGSLGIHFQSSVLKTLGLYVKDVKVEGPYIKFNIERL